MELRLCVRRVPGDVPRDSRVNDQHVFDVFRVTRCPFGQRPTRFWRFPCDSLPGLVFCGGRHQLFFASLPKKPTLEEAGSCGQWDNYRTIFEDLDAIYLFVLQLKD